MSKILEKLKDLINDIYDLIKYDITVFIMIAITIMFAFSMIFIVDKPVKKLHLDVSCFGLDKK